MSTRKDGYKFSVRIWYEEALGNFIFGIMIDELFVLSLVRTKCQCSSFYDDHRITAPVSSESHLWLCLNEPHVTQFVGKKTLMMHDKAALLQRNEEK